MCAEATCSDGVKNGNEERVDCGGDCNVCLDPDEGSFVGGTSCSVTNAGDSRSNNGAWLWLLALGGVLVARRRAPEARH